MLRAADEIALVGLGDLWHYTNATTAHPLSRNWQQLAYNPTRWPTGGSGFGDTTYGENTSLKTLSGDWHTLAMRTTFQVPNPGAVKRLILRVDYGGGILVWINGEEVTRRGLPGKPDNTIPVDTVAQSRRPGRAEEIVFEPKPGLLKPGTNVLAIEAFSDSYWITRPVVIPELLANFSRAPYVQNVGQDHAVIMWTTPEPGQYEVECSSPGQPARIFAEPAATNYHLVTLSGLLPGVAYTYQVAGTMAGANVTTAARVFRTLPASGPIDVIVFGDSGGGSAGQFDVAHHMQDERADLILHMGDIAYPTFVDALADTRFLSVYRPLMREIPFYFAWGNHDFDSGPDAFLHTIRQPTNDVSAELHRLDGTRPEYYGSFDAGEVHFAIVFQPFVSQYLLKPNRAQYEWLDRDLGQSAKPWKVIIAHQPFASSGLHSKDDTNYDGQRDQAQIEESMLSLIRKHGVQLYLGGHDHDYERFHPTSGVYSVTTGGGGSTLYPLLSRDAKSITFQSRFHFLRVHFDHDEVHVRAIGMGGEVFDRFAIRRTAPEAKEYTAAWGTPPLAEGKADDGDGNIRHQRHQFEPAESVTAKGGETSNLGSLQVMLDANNLYIGLAEAMLPQGTDAYLFVGVPGSPGVKSLAGNGNGKIDPNGEGADGLDLAENLGFTDFEPSIGILAGDEFADGTLPGFKRAGSAIALGQGVYHLGAALQSVRGARLQQFNQSPQEVPDQAEQDADFIEIAIPRTELPGLKEGGVLQIAAVAGNAVDVAKPARFFDNGFLGESLTGGGFARTMIKPLRFRLPTRP